jgi:hypothetical protein
VARRAHATVMHRIIATLLLTAVHAFPGAAHSTDGLNGKATLAATSAIGRVTRRKTASRAASANLHSFRPNLKAVISEQDGSHRKAVTLVPGPLNLRLPDLRSIQSSLPPQATRPADADYMLHVAIVGMPARPEKSSNIHLAPTGIGSIYLATRHPAQVWRMLLPIVSHDGSAASEDIRVEFASARAPGCQTACLQDPPNTASYAAFPHGRSLSPAPAMIASTSVFGTLFFYIP